MRIERPGFERLLDTAFGVHSVVALLGPRQAGKTTLARAYAEKHSSFYFTSNYFDLEDPIHETRLANPKLALEGLAGLVVIDEVQRAPELFKVLRVLVDRNDNPAQFLILGSASRDLIRQSSETLSGRIEYIELTPFAATEMDNSKIDQVWLRGGFPRAFLADENQQAFQWLAAFIRTYLEQDLPNLGFSIPPASLRRFWLMLTHTHGNILNMSELARSFGIADTTVKRYLDILVGTFMVRLLPPWHENIAKRQVRRPKVYFRDSGIFHSLLGISSTAALHTHPRLGASWEGFALEQVLRWCRAGEGECYFWSIHSQAELDLLVLRDGKRFGFEFKYTDHPRATRSTRTAAELLSLDSVSIVYPGSERFRLDSNAEAIGLSSLMQSHP